MSPSTRPRSVFTTIASVSAIALGGCNVLLDNRPADINGDLFDTEPSDDAGAAGEAERDVDASVPDPGAPLLGADPTGDARADGAPPADAAGVDAADAATPQCGPCAPPHGAGACVAGECVLAACAAGWADCNHVATDGCEADLSSDTSCGACEITCADGPHATPACVAGACSVACDPGFGDCNHKATDGCEAQLMKDRHNCGACGQVCVLGSCESGACVLRP